MVLAKTRNGGIRVFWHHSIAAASMSQPQTSSPAAAAPADQRVTRPPEQPRSRSRLPGVKAKPWSRAAALYFPARMRPTSRQSASSVAYQCQNSLGGTGRLASRETGNSCCAGAVGW